MFLINLNIMTTLFEDLMTQKTLFDYLSREANATPMHFGKIYDINKLNNSQIKTL